MKMKWVLAALLFMIIAGAAFYYYYNKPRREIDSESAISVTAYELFRDFETNEPEANLKYLDKVVEVSGLVGEISSNQQGKTIVVLESDSAFGGIACTIDGTSAGISVGSDVTMRGICKGFLTDVVVTEAKQKPNNK